MQTKIKVLMLLILMSVGLLLWPLQAKATTGLVYLSPSGSSVQVGNTVTLSLRINPGTTVDSVQATVGFTSSDLQILSADISSSAFPVQLQKTVGSSSVVLALGNLSGGVGSDSLIATLSFKALSSSGTSSVYLSGVNAAYAGSYTNPGTTNATVSFTPVPIPSAGTSSGGSTNISAGAKKTTTTPTTTPTSATPAPATVAAPKVSFTAKTVQYSLASVAVTSDLPVQAAIQFGTDQKKLDHTTNFTDLGTKHSINLDSTQLTPGTTYYYKIVTKNAIGNAATSSIKSFKTKGYAVKVAVLDSHYHPVANKTVTLHSTPITAKTDKNGVATFSDVAPGRHNIEYSLSKNQIFKKDIYVENNVITSGNSQKANGQSLAAVLPGLTLPASHALKDFLTFLGLMFVAAGLGFLVYTILLRKLLTHSTTIIDPPAEVSV